MDKKVLELNAVIRPDGKYYTALCLELDVASFGNTPEEAFTSLQDAVQEYLRYALETGQEDLLYRPVPKSVVREYSRAREGRQVKRRQLKIPIPKIPPLAAALHV